MRKNKTDIPKQLLPSNKKEKFTSQFCFTHDHTLVSYVLDKGKCVILLSTEHHDNKIATERLDKKPDIIPHYNSTKGGVDTVDKMAKEFTTKRKTNR